jgi:hypothetical protein
MQPPTSIRTLCSFFTDPRGFETSKGSEVGKITKKLLDEKYNIVQAFYEHKDFTEKIVLGGNSMLDDFRSKLRVVTLTQLGSTSAKWDDLIDFDYFEQVSLPPSIFTIYSTS